MAGTVGMTRVQECILGFSFSRDGFTASSLMTEKSLIEVHIHIIIIILLSIVLHLFLTCYIDDILIFTCTIYHL